METPMLDGIRKMAARKAGSVRPIFYLVTGRFIDGNGNNRGVRIEPYYVGDSFLDRRDQYNVSLNDALALHQKKEILRTLQGETPESICLGTRIEPYLRNGKIWMRSQRNDRLEDNINHLPVLN